LAFVAQEWVTAAYTRGGLEAAYVVQSRLVETFPWNKDVIESTRNPIRSAIRERAIAGKYEEALKLTEDSTVVLGETHVRELREYIYDTWAKKHIQAKEWEPAAEVYATALQRVGGSSLI
jgi:hypothetical protein